MGEMYLNGSVAQSAFAYSVSFQCLLVIFVLIQRTIMVSKSFNTKVANIKYNHERRRLDPCAARMCHSH